jgi:hypothetical protein
MKKALAENSGTLVYLGWRYAMTTLSLDTNPKSEKIQIEIIKRLPAWRKAAALDDLNETVRVLATSGLRQRYPNATPEQIHRLMADLLLGTELAGKVYGHAG